MPSDLVPPEPSGATQTVWMLWFRPVKGDDDGDLLFVGVYSSREGALAAVERLRSKPGFRDHPMVVEDDRHPGFFLVDNEVDKDHWPEGFRTERV